MPDNDHITRIANLEIKAHTMHSDVQDIKENFADFVDEIHKLSNMLQKLLTQFDEREKRNMDLIQNHKEAFERFDNRIIALSEKRVSDEINRATLESRIKGLENVQKGLIASCLALAVEVLKRMLSG